MPLNDTDPRQVGAFRLVGRDRVEPAGTVYAGSDAAGRSVSVAVLHPGAAGDAAAWERFVSAVHGGDEHGYRPEVLACNTGGSSAPWVAARRRSGQPGAEVFLRAVTVPDGGTPRGAPSYLPHWASSQHPPAAVRWSWLGGGQGAGGAVAAQPSRSVVWGVLALLLVVAVLLVLLYFLLSSLSQQADVNSWQQPSSPPPSPVEAPKPEEDADPQVSPGSPREPSPSSEPPTAPSEGSPPGSPRDPEGLA
ncbi:hypothetical protein FHX37_1639 [Haloactinospora alba]|uniref:Serine/threonine protein kinase n=1 Tax=Haloactinospora alba TaxID=405555 RepID=A0A543NIQ3_9ACTN|nr:hypothetical protein [Haloactinospora alba]TQN31719.1 hypothetical protein FHX37_1639 [Haloactinospora alba]